MLMQELCISLWVRNVLLCCDTAATPLLCWAGNPRWWQQGWQNAQHKYLRTNPSRHCWAIHNWMCQAASDDTGWAPSRAEQPHKMLFMVQEEDLNSSLQRFSQSHKYALQCIQRSRVLCEALRTNPSTEELRDGEEPWAITANYTKLPKYIKHFIKGDQSAFHGKEELWSAFYPRESSGEEAVWPIL